MSGYCSQCGQTGGCDCKKPPEKRDRPELGTSLERKVADVLFESMRNTEGAMVIGPLITGRTAIDGEFDLLSLAKLVVLAVCSEEMRQTPAG